MRLLRMLFVSVSCFSLVLPATAQMMTPTQMREHQQKSYKLSFDNGMKAYNTKHYETSLRWLQDAERYASSREEEYKTKLILAEVYRQIGNKHVLSGGSRDNNYYSSSRSYAKEVREADPTNTLANEILSDIPEIRNRGDRAAARQEWEERERKRMQQLHDREAQRRKEAGSSGVSDVAALAGAALMIYLGGRAIGAAGHYFLGGVASGASGDTKYQCRVQCLRPNRSVFIPVMAGSRAEAASIVTKQAHNVCEYQGSGSATYITLEPEKCEMR